jgi:hypothetical protein
MSNLIVPSRRIITLDDERRSRRGWRRMPGNGYSAGVIPGSLQCLCTCVVAADDCEACSDVTTIRVNYTWTACEGCRSHEGQSRTYSDHVLPATVDLAWQGVYSTSPIKYCWWKNDDVGSVRVRSWNGNATCSGTPDSDYTEKIAHRLYLEAYPEDNINFWTYALGFWSDPPGIGTFWSSFEWGWDDWEANLCATIPDTSFGNCLFHERAFPAAMSFIPNP